MCGDVHEPTEEHNQADVRSFEPSPTFLDSIKLAQSFGAKITPRKTPHKIN